MVKNEIMALEMLENLVGLSEKSFVQFVTYVEDIDETKKIKVFLNILVRIASEKRKKTIHSACKALELSLNNKKVSCNESIRYSEEKINRIGEKNMNNSGIVEQKYIDSREVAEMVRKEHKNILRDIRGYYEELGRLILSQPIFSQKVSTQTSLTGRNLVILSQRKVASL